MPEGASALSAANGRASERCPGAAEWHGPAQLHASRQKRLAELLGAGLERFIRAQPQSCGDDRAISAALCVYTDRAAPRQDLDA